MIYTNGTDYNVTINTPTFKSLPMSTERDYEPMLAMCQDKRFTYPYIHFHKDTQNLPIEERVLKYTQFGDACAAGEYGQFILNALWSPDLKIFYGASIVIATDENDRLFQAANPRNKAEIGAMTNPDYWGHGIATEGLHIAIAHAVNHWNITGLCASVEPGRDASIAIAKRLGMAEVAFIEAGSEIVPYNDKNCNPAGRHILTTPDGWNPKDYLRLVA